MENKMTSLSSGENKMTTICQEEENYVRMNLLLTGISPRAVRVLFDREFDPSCLAASIKKATNKLNDFKKKRIINHSQWNLLFPRNGDPDSNMFDITLMITLLTNLTGLNHYDKLPLVTDTTPAADLGRMKYYRNLVAHHKDGKLDNAFFSNAWEDIIQAVGRLGGKYIFDECKELQTKILEQSTVPWNIRVQISEVLEEWKMNNSNFVETRAANCILEYVQENSCVTITGSSGVGKSATLRHVALQMADDGYNVLPITDPHDIVNFYNPNQKTLFVIDDFCGTYSISQYNLNSLELDMERIKVLIKNKRTKIVVACRLQVYKDDKFESLSIFRTCVCNLLSDELCLSQTEKQSIAALYLNTQAAEIIQYCDLYDCFPLLCKLYSENPKLSITDFFKNPFSVYEEEIDKLLKKGHTGKYCALALCVVFNNRLEEKWLTDEIYEARPIIENTCESCKLSRSTSPLYILDELKSLEYTFVKKEKDVYKTIHDKVFDFLTFYFGQKIIQCLIQNADSQVIGQKFSLVKNDLDQFITVVPPKYHDIYIGRMIYDWTNGTVKCVFNNINMKIPEFRQRFLCILKRNEISIQRQLALTCDAYSKDTVLLQCCLLGDMPLIQWCIHHGVDVNQCNYHDISPLHGSANEGTIEIVKLLLNNKANINKCTNNGTTPLDVACHKNHLEVLKILLENKAVINKCKGDSKSPLHIACQNNNIEIVKVLLDNKADINESADDGSSPLILASWMNHINIVKILLEKKVDINKCTFPGKSPLLIACQKNHIEIVKLLLENNADINKCSEQGTSPLFMACQLNHIEVVELLIKNKADTNKCTDTGQFPLLIASGRNYIEIVQILLDNKADIEKCTDDGVSPLLIACEHNYIEVVKVLLDNKADINKCGDNGISPLCIACGKNYIEIVHILLDNEADINKCADNGVSPLYIACHYNHKEIVKILIDNKADINKCSDNEKSPLHIACHYNHKEIVKILIDNKADINKCSDNEKSPLYIACENNNIEIVKLLLEKADINKSRDNGTSPLCIACEKNYKDIVQVLLDNNANINKGSNNGATPLFIACELNHIELVKVLLENKADINKCLNDGSSPLYIACQNNHKEIVKVLLDSNADINKCEDNGLSPLYIACQNNHKEIVKVLLDSIADINKCEDNGLSPLYIACQNNHKEIVKMLIDNKADMNKCRDDGSSPLYIACCNTHIEVVKILLDKEVDIDICTIILPPPFIVYTLKL